MGRLTARKVETAKPGVYVDGQGLRLIVGATRVRKWVFRFMRRGRSQEMGLGGSDVSLAMARERAAEARQALASGQNPIEAARLAKVRKPTFGQIADEFVAAKQSEWRNVKHRGQWEMTLQRYCAPLRTRPVNEIDTAAVLEVLKPLWANVPETASRLRGRIETVLDAARARELIGANEANPARWRGHLDKLLPKRQKLTRGHHAAMPFSDVPQFMAGLEIVRRYQRSAEFAILTAARSGEVIGARWDEIDFEGRVWTVPATRMKGTRVHRVPLSSRALVILKKLREARTSDFIFPGKRLGRPLSGMALEMILRRMKASNVTVHGFRSSFRDWCGRDFLGFPREVAEAALAHIAGDATERAYRRGDALEKRRELNGSLGSLLRAQGGQCRFDCAVPS